MDQETDPNQKLLQEAKGFHLDYENYRRNEEMKTSVALLFQKREKAHVYTAFFFTPKEKLGFFFIFCFAATDNTEVCIIIFHFCS